MRSPVPAKVRLLHNPGAICQLVRNQKGREPLPVDGQPLRQELPISRWASVGQEVDLEADDEQDSTFGVLNHGLAVCSRPVAWNGWAGDPGRSQVVQVLGRVEWPSTS